MSQGRDGERGLARLRVRVTITVRANPNPHPSPSPNPKPSPTQVSVAELMRHSQQPCSADLPGVQEPLGELLPLQVSADGGCGKWMPIEYRMCAANLPEPPERERDLISFNIYLKEGEFYAA